ISLGAGAEMRRTLGTAVFSGMIGVTLFGLVLTPVFFSTIDRLGESRLFASRIMRRTGAIALGVLTLGGRWMLRTLASRNGRREALRPKVTPGVPHTNGVAKNSEPEIGERVATRS